MYSVKDSSRCVCIKITNQSIATFSDTHSRTSFSPLHLKVDYNPLILVDLSPSRIFQHDAATSWSPSSICDLKINKSLFSWSRFARVPKFKPQRAIAGNNIRKWVLADQILLQAGSFIIKFVYKFLHILKYLSTFSIIQWITFVDIIPKISMIF